MHENKTQINYPKGCPTKNSSWLVRHMRLVLSYGTHKLALFINLNVKGLTSLIILL